MGVSQAFWASVCILFLLTFSSTLPLDSSEVLDANGGWCPSTVSWHIRVLSLSWVFGSALCLTHGWIHAWQRQHELVGLNESLLNLLVDWIKEEINGWKKGKRRGAICVPREKGLKALSCSFGLYLLCQHPSSSLQCPELYEFTPAAGPLRFPELSFLSCP